MLKTKYLYMVFMCAGLALVIGGCSLEKKQEVVVSSIPVVEEESVLSTDLETSEESSEEEIKSESESKSSDLSELPAVNIAGNRIREEESETESEEESKTENIDEEGTYINESIVEAESKKTGITYHSEINNELVDTSIRNQRPIAVMVDNESIALPHYGLTEADVVYELMNSTTNNRITRFMAIVKDWGSIEQFGSIRSARPTNIMLAAEWNAVLVHDGGPFYIDEWLARDYAANLSGGFTRINNGKAREYTEYVCTGELENRFARAGYSTEYNEYYPGEHFTFSNTEVELAYDSGASDCTRVELPFPHNKSTLEYNESTGTYDYSEYGKAHTDPLHDDARLTFKNILIQDCTFAQLDDNGYLIYNAIDSGRGGYYITNGRAIEVTWTKPSESEPTLFYDKQTGQQIVLNTGKIYIALVPSDSWSDLVIR